MIASGRVHIPVVNTSSVNGFWASIGPHLPQTAYAAAKFAAKGFKQQPERFDRIVQSWDTANKATELSDFSVCTTWGVKGKTVYLVGGCASGSNIRHSSARSANSRTSTVPPRC